jgi:DNA-binding GntR family transcriptional regulator
LSLSRIDFQGSELLPERIAGALRKAIVDSVLAPGERLQEQDLAKSLGVSRVPLREAFRVLAGEGLVVIQPHRGAVVSERSDSELRELFAVRAMFEATAASLLAQKRPQATLDALDAMVSGMKAAVRRKKMAEYSTLAVNFHDRIVAECGNTLLGRLYREIRTNLRRYQTLMGDLPGSPAQSIREHEKILAAIRAGNSSAAAREAESHVGELVLRFEKRPKPNQRKKNG